MGSEKKSSRKKKKSSRNDSLELGTTPTSTEIKKSLARKSRQSTEDSDESWLKPYLQYDTPTPVVKHKVDTKDKSPSPESEFFSLISPEKLRLHPKREPSIVNVKSKGTGPHDNRLAKSQGDYREPSLRRGSGMTYSMPDALNNLPAPEAGKSSRNEAQSIESAAGYSTEQTQPLGSQKLGNKNPYAVDQPKASRGDVNPVGHRPLAVIKKPAILEIRTPYDCEKKQEDENNRSSEPPSAKRPHEEYGSSAHKKSTFRACLQLKELYLDISIGRREFWESVKSRLAFIHCSTRWQTLYARVKRWCRPRMRRLKKGTLTEPSGETMEVDLLIDQWNEVRAARFASNHVDSANKNLVEESDGESEAAKPQGELDSSIKQLEDKVRLRPDSATTPSQGEPEGFTEELDDKIWRTVENVLLPFAERKLVEWVEKKLQERMDELELLTRPPLLKADSSPESYHTYVCYLKGRIQATGKNSTSIRETEAVMSMAVDLLPDVKEHLRKELKGEHMDVNDGESDAEGNGAIYQESHDDCSEEVYSKDSEDDVSCYQPSIIDSTEPRTPVVTPRVMDQLRYYESKYVEAARVAKAQKEAVDEALRSLDDSRSKKRKAPDEDLHGLAIRSKSNECKPVHYRVPETPVAPARKKQCLEERQPNRSPASSSISPEFPPIEQIFSSSLARESSAITQPTPTPAGPGLRSTNKSPIFGPFEDDAASTLKSIARAKPSPGLFVTPDRPPSGQSDRLFRIKKSASRNPVLSERAAYREKAEAPRFREETAEYQAMSPESRDMMMYRAIRDMREKRY
ncbi:hypothetical protein FGRMN_2344 [Fusarium graminum]|nr:hypothetical protein FGRMN_2344 [Fusarium graminum]